MIAGGDAGEERWRKRSRRGATAVSAASVSAADLPRSARLTTACPLLDAALHGGLRTRAVHEIVGESNCGKTQLCLQLLLTCQWGRQHGGLGCKSLYINTEGSGGMTTSRLREMLAFHHAKGHSSADAMDNIFIQQGASDPESLMSILARAKALMDQHNVRLVVIDSIANAFKDVLSSEGRPSDALYRIMNLLKRYASEYDACVVLTNHVSDHIEDSAVHRATKRAEVPLHTSGRRVKASLGMGFAQSVTCRYFVSRLHGIRLNEREYDTSGCVRAFAVVFSPFQGIRDTNYIINQSGVWGIPDEVIKEADREPLASPIMEDGHHHG